MRKVVTCLLAIILVLSWAAQPSQSIYNSAQAQEAAPQLDRIRPDTITAGAPTFTIRLEGKKFTQGARVLFDGVELEMARVSTNRKVLLAEVDAGLVAAAGTHTIRAINPDNQMTTTETLAVVEADPELRFQLEGNAAQEKIQTALLVGASGENFNENSKVLVWGKASPETRFIDENTLSFVFPERFLDDPARIPIMVQNKNGRLSNVDIFFVVPRPVTLDSIDPSSIEVGTEDFELSIFAQGLKPDAKVLVNDVEVEVIRRKDERIDTKVPGSLRSTPGRLIVRVEQDGIQSIDEVLSVTPSEDPFIFTISPASIRQGDSRETIDIVGANFGDQDKVLLDGQEVSTRTSTRRRFTIVVKSELLATPGTHTIQVRDQDGAVSNVVSFVVTPDVTVSTLSGASRDGFNPESQCVSAEEAKFRRPRRLALGPDGLLYVTDQQNHAIRTINPATGEVCLVAGTGKSGYNDTGNARGFEPTFSFPNGVAVDTAGRIYVSENGNNVIRRITRGTSGATAVTTFAGASSEVTNRDRQDRLNSTRVGIQGFRNGPALEARFRLPDDMTIAPDGTIYVADANNHSIRRIRQDGGQTVVETIAGNGVPGFADGISGNARFNVPTAVALSLDGAALLVADTNNDRVRSIDLATGRVRTIAGKGQGGGADGPVGEAEFSQPIGLAVDSDGSVYVSEVSGDRVRRIDTSGNVTTLAGDNNTNKFRDGAGLRATFDSPRGIAIDRQRGILYVADTENFRVRKIQLR
jgi:sugar lactone lactonase YvrE